MTDGVVVAISYGGSPKMTEVPYDGAFKSKIHMNWNVGSRDSAYTGSSSYGVKAGYNYFTNKGFSTSLNVISGLGHDRNDFGRVMDAMIKQHVPASGSTEPNPPTPPTPPSAFETTVTPTSNGAKFLVDVPANTQPATYVYVFWGNGNYEYLYSYKDGQDVPFVFTTLKSNRDYTYEVWSDNTLRTEGSFRTR